MYPRAVSLATQFTFGSKLHFIAPLQKMNHMTPMPAVFHQHSPTSKLYPFVGVPDANMEPVAVGVAFFLTKFDHRFGVGFDLGT